MALTTDNTQVAAGGGAGDLISDEAVYDSAGAGQPRLSSLVPQVEAANANYKIERTKLVIGDYGQDRGDPSLDGGRGFPVEIVTEQRRIIEAQFLIARDGATLGNNQLRARERTPALFFSRTSREMGRV